MRCHKGNKMKKIALLIVFSGFLTMKPVYVNAEDFLGAPLIPGGEAIQKTNVRLEMKTKMTHEESVNFYKNALEGLKDIKFRNWEDATYIEDDGNLLWHSITISKEYANGTSIVIIKDNWTWIIGTLILRFVGVFVVLVILLLGMSVSGAIISRAVKHMEIVKQREKRA
ncbi:MAG: hypothetical protein ABII26_06450 [Pseudomonadota bacterium]